MCDATLWSTWNGAGGNGGRLGTKVMESEMIAGISGQEQPPTQQRMQKGGFAVSYNIFH